MDKIFRVVDAPIHQLAASIDKPDDQVRLIICFFIGFGLGVPFRFLRGSFLRHLYSTIAGITLQCFMFRHEVIHSLLMTLGTYILLTILPRKFSALVAFVFNMGYLSYSHITRMLTNWGGWELGITTYTMLLTCKLTALGYCYFDGGEKDEDLNSY